MAKWRGGNGTERLGATVLMPQTIILRHPSGTFAAVTSNPHR
jgi:hypothetical protein